jgi:quercetin dioxygenase-like cupin family protein
MTPMAQMTGPEEGEALWFFGMLVLFKASSEQTAGRFCLTEQRGPRGIATPLHRQPGDEETFYLLEGELRFYLDGEEPITAQAGSTAYIPPGAAHAFEVASDTARWLNLTTPNHEAFFRAAGEEASERTLPPEMAPDMAKVMAAAEKFGVEILGPPPGANPH